MNKFLVIILLAAVQLPAFAQTPTIINDPKAKLRTITGSFTKLAVSSGIELYLTQSPETALAISVSDNSYETMVKTEVRNGVLQVNFDKQGVAWNKDKNRKIKVYLSCETLEGIIGSAGSLIQVVNEFNSAAITLSISSGATFKGRLQTKALTATANSGGEIEVSGVAVNSTLQASSGAMLNAYLLTTKYCNAKVSSGADIKITVEKEITAKASSGGTISYKGSADVTNKHLSSGGTIKQTS
jgi:hypothetical protein